MNCNNKFENYTSLILDRWITVCLPLSVCPSVQPCPKLSRWAPLRIFLIFSIMICHHMTRVKWRSQIFEKLLFFHKWLKRERVKTGWKMPSNWVTWNSLKNVLIHVKKIIRNFLFSCSKSPNGVPSHSRWRCSKWQVFRYSSQTAIAIFLILHMNFGTHV